MQMTKNANVVKTKTANGREVISSNLVVINSSSDEYLVVDTVTLTVLCWTERRGFGFINYPIRFKSHKSAQNWIDSGSIASLQEGKNCLAIGFTDRLIG